MEVWDLYFASICSLRFHPRNDRYYAEEQEVTYAAKIADLMMIEREKRCHGDSQSAPPPAQSAAA